MKKETKMKVGRIGEALLMTVAAAGIISIAVLAPNAMQILKPFLKDKKYSRTKAVERNIDSLIRSGLLTRSINKKGEVTVSLTKRGKWESLLRGKLQDENKQKWDGVWRVVIFDVPNEKRKMRNELRRGIRMFGFHQLQKSVWVYPYQCDEFVRLVKEHLGVTSDVLIMEVQSIENDKELKKHFEI
jgi:CRISPR-associated endonuclease Cas2